MWYIDTHLTIVRHAQKNPKADRSKRGDERKKETSKKEKTPVAVDQVVKINDSNYLKRLMLNSMKRTLGLFHIHKIHINISINHESKWCVQVLYFVRASFPFVFISYLFIFGVFFVVFCFCCGSEQRTHNIYLILWWSIIILNVFHLDLFPLLLFVIYSSFLIQFHVYQWFSFSWHRYFNRHYFVRARYQT